MFGRPHIRYAGGDADNAVRSHLERLLFKPANETIPVHEDDFVSNDQLRLEVVPENDDGLNPSNAGLLHDVFLEAYRASAHPARQMREVIGVIVVVAHLDVNGVPVDRRFTGEPLAVKQEDAGRRDDDVVDVPPTAVLAGAAIR